MNGGVALHVIDPLAKSQASEVVDRQQKEEADSVTNHEKAGKEAAASAVKESNTVKRARILQMGGNVSALVQ